MLSKPIDLPPAVARRFVEDMLAYFAEKNGIRRDEIAARQLHALRQHYSGKLRLTDVTQMFLQMRDQIASGSTSTRASRSAMRTI
jgi:hypothetical protein